MTLNHRSAAIEQQAVDRLKAAKRGREAPPEPTDDLGPHARTGEDIEVSPVEAYAPYADGIANLDSMSERLPARLQREDLLDRPWPDDAISDKEKVDDDADAVSEARARDSLLGPCRASYAQAVLACPQNLRWKVINHAYFCRKSGPANRYETSLPLYELRAVLLYGVRDMTISVRRYSNG